MTAETYLYIFLFTLAIGLFLSPIWLFSKYINPKVSKQVRVLFFFLGVSIIAIIVLLFDSQNLMMIGFWSLVNVLSIYLILKKRNGQPLFVKNNHKEQKTNNSSVELDEEKLWERFNYYFKFLFVLNLIIIMFALSLGGNEPLVNFGLIFLAGIIHLFISFLMVINVGLHAYLLSKKKVYTLFGILGLWWGGLVGIFLAYFAVQWIYYKSINKPFPLSTKIISGVLAIFSLLIMFSFGSVFFPFSEFNRDGINSTNKDQEWTAITSPNEKLTMTLPSNQVYEYTEGSNEKIEAYSYTAEEHDGEVIYFVKYENLQSLANKEGVDIKAFDDEQIKDILKVNVDLKTEKFGVSNFVSKFTFSHGYRAIRFDGEINDDGDTIGIQGVSVFVNGYLYTFMTLTSSGYSADLEKLLDSVSFNSVDK